MQAATIYKICRQAEWSAGQGASVFAGTRDDERDGFIHFSTAEQVAATAAKHFAGKNDLMLLAVDVAVLGSSLVWETARGGELFPHLYAGLPRAAVRWERPLRRDAGGRLVFPELER